jgi:hypothetical protein
MPNRLVAGVTTQEPVCPNGAAERQWCKSWAKAPGSEGRRTPVTAESGHPPDACHLADAPADAVQAVAGLVHGGEHAQRSATSQRFLARL